MLHASNMLLPSQCIQNSMICSSLYVYGLLCFICHVFDTLFCDQHWNWTEIEVLTVLLAVNLGEKKGAWDELTNLRDPPGRSFRTWFACKPGELNAFFLRIVLLQDKGWHIKHNITLKQVPNTIPSKIQSTCKYWPYAGCWEPNPCALASSVDSDSDSAAGGIFPATICIGNKGFSTAAINVSWAQETSTCQVFVSSSHRQLVAPKV